MLRELLLHESSIVPFIDRRNGHSGVFESSTRALANEEEKEGSGLALEAGGIVYFVVNKKQQDVPRTYH